LQLVSAVAVSVLYVKCLLEMSVTFELSFRFYLLYNICEFSDVTTVYSVVY